jgi:Fic family protein
MGIDNLSHSDSDRNQDRRAPNTESSVSSLDAQYKPIEDFSEWAGLAVDSDSWDGYLNDYRAALSEANPEVSGLVERQLGREAAAETGAVEELYTLSVGQTRAIAVESPGWEDALGKDGAQAIDAFRDQFAVYMYVKEAAGSGRPVTASFIRELHAVVARRQDTYMAYFPDGSGALLPIQVSLNKGEYKKGPNHVIRRDGSFVAYAPVSDTEPEMRRLVEQVNTEAFAGAHPILQAAYVHHSLTHIHPFPDGNGRVARALASFYSYQATGLPLLIYSDRKFPYFQALEAADHGEYSVFVDYLSDRVIDTMARATQELRALSGSSLAERLDELLTYIAQQRELTIESATKIGGQLMDAVKAELSAISSQIPGEAGIKVSLSYDNTFIYSNVFGSGYTRGDSVRVVLKIDRPAEISLSAIVGVGVAVDLSSRFTYSIAVADEGGTPRAMQPLSLRFEDVYPSLSHAAHSRILLHAQRIIGMLVDKAKVELRKILRQAGYDSFSD